MAESNHAEIVAVLSSPIGYPLFDFLSAGDLLNEYRSSPSIPCRHDYFRSDFAEMSAPTSPGNPGALPDGWGRLHSPGLGQTDSQEISVRRLSF